MVKALLPEDGKPVYLRDQGIRELPLPGLNAVLARHGLVIHAAKGGDPKCLVACTDAHGQTDEYVVFELRRHPRG
jgi:hypothetical protein